jgi:hypothetical protein
MLKNRLCRIVPLQVGLGERSRRDFCYCWECLAKADPAMDSKISALERAFQLARSGQVSKIEDIKRKLRREGYDENEIFFGQSLRVQLRELIKAARAGITLERRSHVPDRLTFKTPYGVLRSQMPR